MITIDQIRELRERYLELVLLETQTFGVKATEVRHLIGRLGEFHCALEVGGALAHQANQHGFDVISPTGVRISVKTTAQTSGFIQFSKATIDRADQLMVVQFAGGDLATIYHGPFAPAVAVSRFYEPSGCYELDLSKARKLRVGATTPRPLAVFEGGVVSTFYRGSEHVLVIDESAALEALEPADREGLSATREIVFQTAEELDSYARSRGWSGAV